MSDAPTLSLVVPVYNERSLVGTLLDRLFALDLPSVGEIEILVVDDGSTDGSRELLEDLARRRPGAFQLFLEDRSVPAPLGEPVPQDQAIVGQPQ